ncbi:serine protease [Methylobacterium sp. J-072]|uniref:S1C family serine protease n=1 Tax=Methylobacterium sp. J-072 TaxID=2836651 RepID=UPI001FB9F823|nr:serine protease [Methylobacterium sp. J-072]MCJ2093276.1 serine protease [Methylobacterium sp. J-072]
MSRSKVAWAFLLTVGLAVPPAAASPAPPNLTVDKTFGKVAGWSIGYSESLGGCLAAASYGDGTTLWFGFGGARGSSYLALTNAKWRSLEVGGQYDIQMIAGHEKWRGTFTGFERGDAHGLFQSGLKERFVADLSNAGSISVIFQGRQIAVLSLVGSTEAFDAVMGCQKDVISAAAKEAPGLTKPRKLEAGMVSTGTGFYVSERGHLLTNNHVVESCSDFSVRQPGRPLLTARLVARDATNDLAVLATDTPQKAVPPLSVRARLGENVYVYGYPQSDVLASTGNFTIGNVTATAGSGDDTRKIQISAPVHQGNSGGPALDQYGNVIGVVQSKQVAFASGDVPQNVNFAIKSTIALNFLEANGVEAPITVRTTDPMDGAGIAEKARDFTVQVVCH